MERESGRDFRACLRGIFIVLHKKGKGGFLLDQINPKCFSDLGKTAFSISGAYSGNGLQVSINLDSLIHFDQFRAFFIQNVKEESVCKCLL